jgi:hypothetical protein
MRAHQVADILDEEEVALTEHAACFVHGRTPNFAARLRDAMSASRADHVAGKGGLAAGDRSYVSRADHSAMSVSASATAT